MSIDPEASPFEEALRADLPSAEREARLRRRLLAAGVAIGSGITTTAAAGAAGSGAALTANVVGLSWGVKLGFAAAVAIPTLGLLLDAGEPQPTPQPSVVSAAATLPVAPEKRASRIEPPAARAPELRLEDPAPSIPTPVPSTPARREQASIVVPPIAQPPSLEQPGSERAFAVPADAPAVVPERKSSLAEETRLLDSAFAELAAGDRARAAQLIAEHEARYPQGLLSKERERAKLRVSEMSRGN